MSSFQIFFTSLQANGVKWVVVGDENYVEVSSREHAALEPRHLILEDEQSSSRALHESTVGFVAVYLPIHSRWPVYP